MPGSPDRMDADGHKEPPGTTHRVMYLVKRPSYDFVFAIPKDDALFLNTDRAIFQVCFKGQRQSRSFVLNLEELQEFHDGLSCLMEYIRTERDKRCTEL